MSPIDLIRSIVLKRCNFYISQHYSSASFERIGSGDWDARYYFASVFIEVYYNKEDKRLTLTVWTYHRAALDRRECEGVEINEV